MRNDPDATRQLGRRSGCCGWNKRNEPEQQSGHSSTQGDNRAQAIEYNPETGDRGPHAAAVAAAAEAGQREFGENYVREGVAKIELLRDRGLTWHFIGQLQANKTREVAEHFQWVHTVDREKIARRLSEQRPHYAPPLQVCLQVHLGDEPTKSGAAPAALEALAAQVASLPQLRLRGLMCIPPAGDDPARQRHWFAEVRRLRDALNYRGHALDVLSMGMSADFELAIADIPNYLNDQIWSMRPPPKYRGTKRPTGDRIHWQQHP